MSRLERLRALDAIKGSLDADRLKSIQGHIERELASETKRINRMSKLKSLGGMVRDGVAALENDAEKVVNRLNALKARGNVAFGKLNDELNSYEQAVNEAEQSLSQASNGGPPIAKG